MADRIRFLSWWLHAGRGKHCPAVPKFEGVWLEYKQEKSRRQENDWLCYSYACRIFFEEISNIRLVRSKGTHVCCKVCTSYQMRILKAKTDHMRSELKKLHKYNWMWRNNDKKSCFRMGIRKEQFNYPISSYLSLWTGWTNQNKCATFFSKDFG